MEGVIRASIPDGKMFIICKAKFQIPDPNDNRKTICALSCQSVNLVQAHPVVSVTAHIAEPVFVMVPLPVEVDVAVDAALNDGPSL